MPELPLDRIDRRSPVPFWFQLAGQLEQEIVSGRWGRGERLPAEPKIAGHYGLSRSTVRQALQRLEQEGLISRRRGIGSFVTESHPRSWLLQSPEGFFQDEVDRMGRKVTSKMLRREMETLPRWASDALGLASESQGVVVERVRSVDGRVALYVTDYLPADLQESVLSFDGSTESLYAHLRARDGLAVAGGRRSLEATKAGERLGRLLEVDASTPLVFIESVAWDRDLRPFHCYRAWVRTDRMKIELLVSALPASAVEALAVESGGRDLTP